MASGELEPTSDHPAGGSARPKLVLINGDRNAPGPDDSEGRRPGRIRRFASDIWDAMITFNSDYPSPHPWTD